MASIVHTDTPYLDRLGTKALLEEIKERIPGADIDMTNYYTKGQVDTKLPKKLSDLNQDNDHQTVTATEKASWSNRAGLATEEYVRSAIASAELSGEGGEVDLTDYATKTYVDSAVSNVTPNMSGYATESYVTNAIAQAQLEDSDVDLSGYSQVGHTHTLSDIADYSAPDLSSYASKSYVDNAVTEAESSPVVSDVLVDVTSQIFDQSGLRVIHSPQLPTLPTFSGGTKLYVTPPTWAEDYWADIPVAARMRSGSNFINGENLYVNDYEDETQDYVLIPDTSDGYLDDYEIFGASYYNSRPNPSLTTSKACYAQYVDELKPYQYTYIEDGELKYSDIYTLFKINVSSLTGNISITFHPYHHYHHSDVYMDIPWDEWVYPSRVIVLGDSDIHTSGNQSASTYVNYTFASPNTYTINRLDDYSRQVIVDVTNRTWLPILVGGTGANKHTTNGSDIDPCVDSNGYLQWSYWNPRPVSQKYEFSYYAVGATGQYSVWTTNLDGTRTSEVTTFTVNATDFTPTDVLRYSTDPICELQDIPLSEYIKYNYPNNLTDWKYLGYTNQDNVINLPSSFTELYIVTTANAWNTHTFSIPYIAIQEHSSIGSETGVPNGTYYKTGTCEMIRSSNVYADGLIYLISKSKAKLNSWKHNEGSSTAVDMLSNATTYWYWR